MAPRDTMKITQLGGSIGECEPPFVRICKYINRFRGSVVDGLFSWESAWPIRPDATPPVGGNFPGDVSLDKTVIQGTTAHGHDSYGLQSTLS
jgi:hypothetical protein